ncbi:MAG: DNA repair protein RecN [Acidimicrobiia bacterium]|nr:DNA repair protein RecN [Acidimicrobiia bacterium]
MLTDLVIRNMVLIDELVLEFEGGMTVLTGETGAGKTLLTQAVGLLAGGRANPGLIRTGAGEAEVEGRFVDDDGTELVVRRVVPTGGRARAYLDGHLAPVSALQEAVGGRVDICGQHNHQALLRPGMRRDALDRFADLDAAPLAEARRRCAELSERLAALGGDERARARELDILEHQIATLDAADLSDPDEEEHLEATERMLSEATAIREAAAGAAYLLGADGPGGETLGEALSQLERFEPLAEVVGRLRHLAEEAGEVSSELRRLADEVREDPVRLTEVIERRALLAGLRHRYGTTLADVMAFGDEAQARLAELRDAEGAAVRLGAELAAAQELERAEAARLGECRRRAAPALAEAVTAELRQLAMPNAGLHLRVGAGPGDEVEYLLAVNSGVTPAPLAQVASGGELSRTMLALHVVLMAAPPTVLLDEVDAGIGGEAGTAVGRALATLATGPQTLVVTHLPQVAAYADAHVSLQKIDDGTRTRITARTLDEDGRLVELARMLSGSPHSGSAREHAAELLARATAERFEPEPS